MAERVLITGATGFAGGHLAEALCPQKDVDVLGLSRHPEWPEGLRFLADRVRLLAGDLTDRAATAEMIRDLRPRQVFHLAGYASPAQSLREPDAAWLANLTATRNLYDALQAFSPGTRVLYVSSGLIYGDTGDGSACRETQPLQPTTPYASSKAAADLVSYQYAHDPDPARRLDIIVVRPFNHFGPRQSTRYAVGNFASQIALIQANRQPPLLQTGNLQGMRDLTDVRDMVQAYLLLMKRGRRGEVYNAGSGVLISMQAVVDRLVELSGVNIETKQATDAGAGAGTIGPRANADKLRAETGWTPTYSLDQTLADTLAFWRSQSRG